MADVSRFLKGADERNSKTVYLSPDPQAVSAAQAADTARRGGSLADPPQDAEHDDVDARQAAIDSAWAFNVGTLPALMWNHLRRAHPATEEQRQAAREVRQSLEFDIERFPQAAVAACLRWASNPDGERITFDRPRWTEDGDVALDPDAQDLAKAVWDTFPLGDTGRIWNAVLTLNGTTPLSGQVQSFADGSATTRSGVR